MFEIRQCTHPDCRLRIPIDPGLLCGDFCPRCGGMMVQVAAPYDNPQLAIDVHPKRQIRVLLDNVRSAYNTGAIFRTADGIGAAHLYLCGITPNPIDNPAIRKTALGAEITLPWSVHLNAHDLGQALQNAGYRLLALETRPESVPIFEFDPHTITSEAVVLVVGSEQAGVDPGIIDLCGGVLSVPMAGSKGSLNVAVAFGVAAYWLTFS